MRQLSILQSLAALAIVGFLASCTSNGATPNTPAVHFGAATEYAVPTGGSAPDGLVAGPDGKMWFTEFAGNKIGDSTLGGSVTEVATLPGGSQPFGIAPGADGRLWFAEESTSNEIGAIATGGTVSQYTGTLGFSRDVVLGPDNRIWFTDPGDNAIEAITTGGTLSVYPIPTAGSSPWGITVGPDGNMWFTEAGSAPKIGKITTGGTITEYPVSGVHSPGYLVFIATGSDGNLWFTDYTGNQVGKMTTSGTVTFYNPPTAGSEPDGITSGPDGDIYFTEAGVGKIGAIVPSTGQIVESATLPSGAGSGPYIITTGPDGNVWFTEATGNKIGKIAVSI
jgi:virginiamycin B lyase